MGCTSSTAEDAKNHELNREQQEAKQEMKETIKLLLLGTGDSGKTTWRKQIANLYSNSFASESTRRNLAHVVIGNLLQGCQAISKATETLKIEIASQQTKEAMAIVLSYKPKADGVLTPEMASAVNTLWGDPDIKRTFEMRSQFQLQDCWKAFVDSCANYPEWGGPAWIPTVDECVRARIRTSGIIEEDFDLRGVHFKLFDAGGQRAERRKWIHCFEGVTAVIFLAASSEYDQVLFEASEVNRLSEALSLFSEMCHNATFANVPMILFLNKMDLFQEKFQVRRIPLNASGLFPDAPEDQDDVPKALEWMANQFLKQKEDIVPAKEVFVHHTTATDPQNVEKVFSDCTAIVLQNSLAKAGLD